LWGVNSSSDENAKKTVDYLTEVAGRKLAMHIVAAKPSFLAAENAPQEFIEKELAIFREQSKDEKKKPEIIEKMIQGKLNKRLSEVCLLGQAHMAEEGNPVIKKYLDGLSKQHGATISIVDYLLWSLKQ
jgi:elongation factor Ts